MRLATEPLQIAPLYPGRLLRELTILCRPAAQRKGLEFRVEPYTDAHDVIGDENRLRLAVASLLANSIKHTATGWVGLAAYPSDGLHWGILIEDTGSGMTPEQTKCAFEACPLEWTPANLRGRSLGLAICKQWIERLHGKLSFSSALTDGMLCQVTLPVMLRDF